MTKTVQEPHYTALALMGALVVVKQRLVRRYEKDKRIWVSTPMLPRTGWVVGMRWKQNGTYKPGSGYYDDYEQPSLKQESRVPCLAVVFWPTETPCYVPFDGYDVVTPGDGSPAPHPASYPWSEQDRAALRKRSQGCEGAVRFGAI